MPTPIREIKSLERYSVLLETLGYDTLEHFVDAATPAGHPLNPYFDEKTVKIVDELTRDSPSLKFDASQDFPLGVTLNRIPLKAGLRHGFFIDFGAIPESSFEPTLKTEVNLIDEEALPIRDQGKKRGTCVAHATVAAYENFLLRKRNGLVREMSEQFMHFLCKENDNSTEGTFLGVAFPKLSLRGCCLEDTWHYNPEPIPGNFSQAPAPAAALNQAEVFSETPPFDFLRVDTPTTNSVTELKAILADDRCVAVSIPAFDSWYNSPMVIKTGDIVMPGPTEVAGELGHSMCLIGYMDLPNIIGGGRFIVRNSWGKRWGKQSKFGAGYGTIPYGFIHAHCTEAFAILP